MSYIQSVNISVLNLNLLPVLDALLTERSVSRAGARLGLSQPAVSNALAQLRALLRRSAAGAQAQRHGADRARARPGGPAARGAAGARAGAGAARAPSIPPRAERDFTIVTNDFVAFALLPRLLARLQREAPGVHLQVRAWQEHVVPSELARGDADLVLGFNRGLPAGHHATPLFERSFRLRRARRATRVVRGKITLATYTKLAHVLVSHEPNARGIVDDLLAQRGLTRNVALRVSHFLLVPPIIAATDYVAALSEIVAEPWPRSLPTAAPEDAADVRGRRGPHGLARANGRVAGARLAAGRRRGGGAGDRDVVPEASRGLKMA